MKFGCLLLPDRHDGTVCFVEVICDRTHNVARFEPTPHALSDSTAMSNSFGHVPGVPVGSIFPNRRALAVAGIHYVQQGGIWKLKGENGARSIVVSGGY